MRFLKALFGKASGRRVSVDKVEEISPGQTEGENSEYETLRSVAVQHLDRFEYEAAVQMFSSALGLNPQSSEANLNVAYTLKELGRLHEASPFFEQSIKLNVQNFDAHFVQGLNFVELQQTQLACDSFARALEINPASTDARTALFRQYFANGRPEEIEIWLMKHQDPEKTPAQTQLQIGEAYFNLLGKQSDNTIVFDYALKHYTASLALNPKSTYALSALGLVYIAQGAHDLAIGTYKSILAIDPQNLEAYRGLAIMHRSNDEFERAKAHLKKAIEINPKDVECHKLLADIHAQCGEFQEAADHFEVVRSEKPDYVNALVAYGQTLMNMGKFDNALAMTKTALALDKESASTIFAIGNLFLLNRQFVLAIEQFKMALLLQPDFMDARHNLAAAYMGIGETSRAYKIYLELIEARPERALCHQTAAFCSTYEPVLLPAVHLNHAKQFGLLVARQRTMLYRHLSSVPTTARPLRVGFVSGDFCMHPVGFFLESVMAHLDAEEIEVHAFSNKTVSDPLQSSLRSRFCTWASIEGLSDGAAASLIFNKKLDVLIDLAGHSANNRLAVFAYKPAPVQATWLGYWGSTGVAEVDYILADRVSIPSSHCDQFTERVWYLPHSRLCFTPPSAVYDLVPAHPPALKNGSVTFGCYQSILKLNDGVLEAWGVIAQHMPTAKFRLQGKGFTHPQTQSELLRRLSQAGIPASSVSLCESTGRVEYLRSHDEVDLILDTFPFPGGTTTCDSLWMGVPTVTLAGATMISRQGASMLEVVGLSDWIAQSEAEYVAIALAKAADVGGLKALRARLRQQAFDSPLFNAPLFAEDLTATLRAMVEDAYSRAQPLVSPGVA